MSKWSETTRRDFDTAAPDVQLGLFAADSQGYTGADLFSEQEDEAAAAPRTHLKSSTGLVHIAAEDGKRPLCRLGAYSGLGVTGRKAPAYTRTTKEATCQKCIANV